MWRNGSGHRAVRSSGPRSHASGNDQAKKNSRLAEVAVPIGAQSATAIEAAEREKEKRALLANRHKDGILLLHELGDGNVPMMDPAATAPAKPAEAGAVESEEEKRKKMEEKRKFLEQKVKELREEQEREEREKAEQEEKQKDSAAQK